MEVTFEKLGGGRVCRWRAVRSKGRVTGSLMGVGHAQLPHDLVQFVVEAELGLTDGFWGSIEQGATFKSGTRRRTEQGRAVVQRNRVALDDAERQANSHGQAWRDGQPTPLRDALDGMHARWAAVPDGGSLVVRWPASPVRRAATRRAARARR